MKNKKKIIVSIVAVVLLLVCAVGATLAWFTDSDDARTNTFVVGNVEIVLYEQKAADDVKVTNKAGADAAQELYDAYLEDFFYDYDEVEGVNVEAANIFVPGATINKYAYVENIGTVKSWIGATYSIPTKLVTDMGEDGVDTDDYYGIDVTVNAAWKLLGTKEVGGITTYYYGLIDTLAAGAKAPAFVESVGINAKATNEEDNDFFHKLAGLIADSDDVVDAANRTFNIEINAYAIQEPSLGAAGVGAALATGFPSIFAGYDPA